MSKGSKGNRAISGVLASALASVFLLAGCNAEVKAFSATPRHICPGERVALHWSVVGSATLNAMPPSAGVSNGPVGDEGDATITPGTTTSVKLHVSRVLGSPTTSTQEILVKAPDDHAELLTASMGDALATAGC